MSRNYQILKDLHDRDHTYLRISLVERCNLRCFYCMPADGVPLSPKTDIMTYEEIYEIAKTFVRNGVTKIRLTGGEPFVRKDIALILEKLATLPVDLSITTNAVIIHNFIDILKMNRVRNINLSLDTLNRNRYKEITLRDQFSRVYENLFLLVKEGFNVKINVVLMRGVNCDEIIDFIQLSQHLPVSVRFIEFMPFYGNKWGISKMVSYQEIMDYAYETFNAADIEHLPDAANDTAKNYRIKGYKGSFAVISSVTKPFCDSCNRLRITANGQLKNCLFSSEESDLVSLLRNGHSIEPVIQKAVQAKFKTRGGMDSMEKLQQPSMHTKNRSMTTIGG